jgi:hypothetical protein
MMRLRAERVWVNHDPGFAAVTFAEEGDEAAAYVVLSRKLDAADIDRRLGMDGVYVELDDDGHAAWRAATAYTLRGRTVRIAIAEDACDRLGIDDDITIELADDELDRSELRQALAAIFNSER